MTELFPFKPQGTCRTCAHRRKVVPYYGKPYFYCKAKIGEPRTRSNKTCELYKTQASKQYFDK